MSDVKYVGTVGALVEKKAGWHTVEISVPGKQYPVKADTKLEHLLKQAREVRDGGMVATFTVSEEESENINPKNNMPYIERRLQKIEFGAEGHVNASGSPTSAATGSSSEGMTKEEWARKDSAIHKMACIKTAADALKHTIPSEPSTEDLNTYNRNVIDLANRWHRSVLAERDDPTGEDVPF